MLSFFLHTFSAFWLRSSVVSVLLSLISETWGISPDRLIRKISEAIWSIELWLIFVSSLWSACWQTLLYLKRDPSIAVPLGVAGIIIIITNFSNHSNHWITWLIHHNYHWLFTNQLMIMYKSLIDYQCKLQHHFQACPDEYLSKIDCRSIAWCTFGISHAYCDQYNNSCL